ncbi:MAG: elongator complex protein 3 [Sedimentibacter sp.]
MNKKMKIIPIFVPHIGCPNDCVFCNQKKITGKGTIVANSRYVTEIVEECRKTISEDTYTEIAFFGGSFTAINVELQEELLSVAKFYKDLGVVDRIRCSTRPDAINTEILQLQKKYGMDIIELGIQSLDDEVLKLSNRGHNRTDSINASKLIKEWGFILGHQIMPGLPGSNREKDIKTCLESISMKPDMVRIYPTLIIKDTELLNMYEQGNYIPLDLQEAVDVSAFIYSQYSINNINVIRIGLQNTESINEEEDVVAGPFHSAFRQLVEEKIYFASLAQTLHGMNLKNKNITIHASNKYISFIAGQKKSNIIRLKELFSMSKITFKDSLTEHLIEIYNDNIKIGSFDINDIYQNYLNLQ